MVQLFLPTHGHFNIGTIDLKVHWGSNNFSKFRQITIFNTITLNFSKYFIQYETSSRHLRLISLCNGVASTDNIESTLEQRAHFIIKRYLLLQFIVNFFRISTFMTGLNFYSPCNENCSCHADLYAPVCDQNNKQYFSPCFAGCTTVNSSSEQVQVLVSSSLHVTVCFCLFVCFDLC